MQPMANSNRPIQHSQVGNKHATTSQSQDPAQNQAEKLILVSAKKVAVSQAFTTPFFHISVTDHPIFALGQVIWRFLASLVPNRQQANATDASNAAAKPTNPVANKPKLTANHQTAIAPKSSNGSGKPARPAEKGVDLAPTASAPRKDVDILFAELRLNPTFCDFASPKLQDLFKNLYVHSEIDESTLKAFIDTNKSPQRYLDLDNMLNDRRTAEKLVLGTRFFLVDCSSDVINKLTDESAKTLIGSDGLTATQIKLINSHNNSFIIDPDVDPLDPARLTDMVKDSFKYDDKNSMNRYLTRIGLV